MSLIIDEAEEPGYTIPARECPANRLVSVEFTPGAGEPWREGPQFVGRRTAVITGIDPGGKLIEPGLQSVDLGLGCRL